MDFETPEADAVEQAQQDTAGLDEDDYDPTDLPDLPSDANPADVEDQRWAVPDDSEDRD